VPLSIGVLPIALHAVPFQAATRSAAAIPPALVKLPPTSSNPGASAFREETVPSSDGVVEVAPAPR
jgi:hypothetical protein